MSKLLKRGFTLVEMMVAIAILAISAMLIYSSNSNAIRHQLVLEETTIGHWLLLNAIEEEKINRVVSPELATEPIESKTVDFGHKRYLITRNSLETDNDDVELVDFSIELIDPDTGDHLIDHITTMMPKSE